MRVLGCVLGALVLLLLLLSQLRVGVQGEYGKTGGVLRVRVGALRLQVWPWLYPKGKKPKKKPKKPPVKTAQPAREPVQKPQESLPDRLKSGWELLQAMLPPVLEAASRFRKKLRVDELKLFLTVGGSDPADAALRYGRANAALGALWYPIVETLDVKDGLARVIWDEQCDKNMECTGRLALSLKLGQVLVLVVRSGVRLLRIYRAERNQQQKRKAA